MYIEDLWKTSTADARKILGSRGDIPAGRISQFFKFRKDMEQVIAAFAKSKVDLGNRLLDLQNSVSKLQNALKDARIEVTRDDYDLDPKNPDDKKKIDAASKVLDRFFVAGATGLSEFTRQLDSLEDHLDHMEKYKAAKV